MGSFAERDSTDFSTFFDSLPEQVANNIIHNIERFANNIIVVMNVVVGPSKHLVRIY